MPMLAIVSPHDNPVYQTTFSQVNAGKNATLEQLVLHSSLDMVDEKVSIIILQLHYIPCLSSSS